MKLSVGAVFFDETFIFHDGDTSPKLFIVLGVDGDAAIIAKTTGQSHRYKLDYGCQAAHRFPAFFLPQGSCLFERHTWVCLNDFYEMSSRKVILDMVYSKIRRIGDIDDGILEEIMRCAMESPDISSMQASIIDGCL